MKILIVLLGLLVLFFSVVMIGRFINRLKYDIHSKEGVQKEEYVSLGGIEQYLQVRGQNKENPIIIVIHGGPGQNMAYFSYQWQQELERDYTIVHWDQRGSGNTYYRNPKAEAATFDLLSSDLDELVDYVRTEYSQDKVIIMGVSWGSVLGGVYANRHPEKVSAYIGAGQFTEPWPSEQYAAEEAIRRANAADKAEDAKKIEDQFKRLQANKKLDIMEFLLLRQLTAKYLPSGENIPFSAILFSPYMTFSNLKWLFLPSFNFDKFAETQGKIFDFLYSDSDFTMYDYTKYKVPVVILAGDCDWITPYDKSRDYFYKITAPKKEFITLENAGHLPYRPGKMPQELLTALRDIL